jgi:tetratricopeptide (TPR) repeat protein
MPHLHRAVELMPDSGGAWLNLARGQMLSGDNEQALQSLDRADPLPDKEPEIYRVTRAEVLSRLGRRRDAVAQLRKAVAEGQGDALPTVVMMLAAQGEHDQAWQTLREELERKPDDVRLLELAAELAQVRGRFIESDRFLDRALQVEPDNAALWRRRAMMAGRRLGSESGRAAADRALELSQDTGGMAYAQALAVHAHVLNEEEKPAEAEAAYREALALAPRCVPALSGLGQLLMQLGRVEEATTVFEELREVAPLQGWSQLIHARQVPDDPAVLEQLERAALRESLEGPVQSHMLFTLSSAWDKKGDHDKAWRFATQANEASRARLNYRPEVHRQRIEREIARFSRAFMQSRQGWGDPSSLPVFVLGMPRSGTTLVEQILGSHSQVFGAGELSLVPELIQKLNAWEIKTGSRREYPECIDDMTIEESRRFAARHLEELQAYAPGALRIVDKLPHNFEHVGLIKLIFPNARILHLKREPRDIAISNYFVDYSAKFGGMGFAYDLSWIGEQLVDHARLMQHWHQVFPGAILEVDYDLLVEDVEGWARRIIDYLGLEWEPGVLSFQNLERAVKTASVWQVRQPVYRSSKERWRAYEAHLGPLEAALSEVPPMPVASPLPRLEPGLFLKGMGQLQSGQLEEAEESLRALIAARPSHAAGHHFLGATLYQQQQFEEARTAMRRSLELIPNQRQWLENLAKVETAIGNEQEAKRIRGRLDSANAESRRRGRLPPAGEGMIDPANAHQAEFTELLTDELHRSPHR